MVNQSWKKDVLHDPEGLVVNPVPVPVSNSRVLVVVTMSGSVCYQNIMQGPLSKDWIMLTIGAINAKCHKISKVYFLSQKQFHQTIKKYKRTGCYSHLNLLSQQ